MGRAAQRGEEAERKVLHLVDGDQHSDAALRPCFGDRARELRKVELEIARVAGTRGCGPDP